MAKTRHRSAPASENHVIHGWEVANAAARLALVPTASDLGRVARQADDGSLWALLDTSPPAWSRVDSDPATEAYRAAFGRMFLTTAEGLGAVGPGEYFLTPGPVPGESVRIYRDDTTVATLIGTMPTTASVQTPAVVATPAAGTYAVAQSVVLNCQAPGSLIFYTTNGTDPTTASTPYTGPISVPATATIKALAVFPGFQPSSILAATYTINANKYLALLSDRAVPASANYAYVRSSWDATRDLVVKASFSVSSTINDPIELEGARLIPIDTTDAGTPAAHTASTDIIAVQGDDAEAVVINAIRYGGNHGPLVCLRVTVASHALTPEDVGSRWRDSALKEWTLVRIFSATSLWFMPNNTGTSTKWVFPMSVTGTTMTHLAGATHTGAITFSAPTTDGPENILQRQVKTWALDGTPVTPGTWRGRVLEMVDTYELPNMASALDYIRASVGSNPAKNLNDAAVASQLRIACRHRFTPDGGITYHYEITFLQECDMTAGYFGGGPLSLLTRGANNLQLYAPRVEPWIGAAPYTLSALEDITTLPGEQLELTSARWSDPADPPDRWAQIATLAGVVQYGEMMGLHRLVGDGTPAARVLATSNAGYMSVAGKPAFRIRDALGGATQPAGQVYTWVAFRCYWPGARLPQATCWGSYFVEGVPYFVADFHQSVTALPLQLPVAYAGAPVEVVQRSAGCSLGASVVDGAGQVPVTVIGGYGYVIFRLP